MLVRVSQMEAEKYELQMRVAELSRILEKNVLQKEADSDAMKSREAAVQELQLNVGSLQNRSKDDMWTAFYAILGAVMVTSLTWFKVMRDSMTAVKQVTDLEKKDLRERLRAVLESQVSQMQGIVKKSKEHCLSTASRGLTLSNSELKLDVELERVCLKQPSSVQ